MGRIADFFGAPLRRNVQIPQVQNHRPVEMPVNRPNAGNLINPVPQPVVEPPAPGIQERVPILVQRNQDPDQIVRQAQQVNLQGQNNIANVVETLLTQNGFNLGLHRPKFVSPLPEYVTMEELPRDRVQQVERLKAEKARASKYGGKKEKVAYVDTDNNNQDFDVGWCLVKESEVNIAELQP
ncbi:hypothetical protein MTR_0063s0070 [Medicago truncatula]|uniref:Uncharacterized protein n=1 Tax=Medicago truncatula TaxID=3880 RepID=A0A072TIB3_MEDTR|nr:hypothetical protein MTR_0063s0070 [Medicago truncatula]